MKGSLLALALGIGLVPASPCQTPDALVKLDLHLVFVGGAGKDTVFRSYDLRGTPSTVGLNMTLEPGFQAVVRQRFQRVPGNADVDQLDEGYVEDPGYWRAGKQFLPFGAGRLLVETVTAGRIDRTVGGDLVPAKLAICQGPKGLPKGLVGRVGGKFGVSFAVGDNFGVSATSLANVRRVEDSPGKGRGWSRVLGVDFTTSRDRWTTSLEAAQFAHGATNSDQDQTVTDLQFTLHPAADRSFSLGWGKVWETGIEVFRIEASIPLADSLWVEPALRLRGGRVMDAALMLYIRL